MKNRKLKTLENLGEKTEAWEDSIASAREIVLSNLSMISQIPARTFNEKARSEFLLERFVESGVEEPQTDEVFNAIGKIKGTGSSRTILVTTHMDNQFEPDVDQNITISEDKVHGASIAEDNIALAVLSSLPDIFARADFHTKSNINLLATTRFHGRGDFDGIRHYIKNCEKEPDFVINLSGINLGEIDYFTLSRVRCDIKIELDIPANTAWMKATHNSAIIVANEIINAILGIPLPKKPKSVLNIGILHGGERYSTVSREASINLELLSEEDDITDYVIEKINDHCLDIGARHGVDVKTEFFGRHHAVGLSCSHPLIKSAIEIIKTLKYQPMMDYFNTEITVPLAKGIPSVSMGLTTGVGGNTARAYIDIKPLIKGILQLMMLIYMIDKGCCDE